ncbi:MAG: class I SAM-dependent methyltransferase [Mycoplasmoidaceae bacterium]|nr:MAG: class I SAM-dependent methyltransferase [Mycoplasmoidaceae bacterium]
MKISNRLNSITRRIKKNSVIIDVGSDHAYTAINALRNAKAKFVYNIELNKSPLKSGIENLIKEDLLSKTKNIIANGLRTNEIKEPIDYCIISGLGGNTIVSILSNSSVNNIKEYILVTNDHPEIIRRYVKENNLKISHEEMIFENKIFYSLIQISLKGKKVISFSDEYFGPINKKQLNNILISYLKQLLIQHKKIYSLSKKQSENKIIMEIEKILHDK